MSSTQVDKPLIIVGTGRCGSTMLHRLLALHDELGWLSTFNESFPSRTWLSAFSEAYRWPLPWAVRHLRAFPKPYEAYRFWEHYLPGFSRRDRPPRPHDVPAGTTGPVRRATASVLGFQRRNRLLVKVTGWSRIAYFDRIYPSAAFVSVRRDPRSVVSSWLNAGWLDVTSPPASDGWQWGAVPAPYLELWRQLGGDPVLSVALKIRLDLDDIARNMALFPDRCHELRYEDLISSPGSTMHDLCRFANLRWSREFERTVREMKFYDSTEKWRRHLTQEQGELVLEFLRTAESVAESEGRGVVPDELSPR